VGETINQLCDGGRVGGKREIAHNNINGNLSLGCWNLPPVEEAEVSQLTGATKNPSQGAGVNSAHG
jgi:hypothetical protein